MPPHRSPKRAPFGVHNRLPPVSEEGSDDESVATTKTVISAPRLHNNKTPPPRGGRAPPEEEAEPTLEELEEADKELARMEAALAASQASDPISRQNVSIIEADEDDSEAEDDDEDSSESDEDDDPQGGQNWSLSSRRSSRRSSVQHLSARERKALKRLSSILRDGGASRRAQEQRESIAVCTRMFEKEAERRRQSERKRRMRSIAKLIDLSLVWQWLEKVELSDLGDGHDDDDDSESSSESEEDEEEEDPRRRQTLKKKKRSLVDTDRLDAEAVKVVETIAANSMAEALGVELGLSYDNESRQKPTVLATLRDLSDLREFRSRVARYDKATGFYEVVSSVGNGVFLTSRRSWKDLKRLARGLAQRGVPAIPRLPRPRYVSSAKKAFGNFFRGKRRGDRTWEASKLRLVDDWLRNLVALVADHQRFSSSSKQSSSLSSFYAGFCLSPASEHLEDFLLKFAHVSSA